MTERRRFNTSERVALYLAADGRCEECGEPLEPGWHGDHEQPWSKGGPTDVINGQALCPRCNLKKGATNVGLHGWQDDALVRFLSREGDFLCVATPGAGKTRFALAAAQQMIDRGQIRRLIVVAPTAHLRTQWSKVAAKHVGIQLDDDFRHGAGALAKDYDGVAVTYHAVATQPSLYRKITSAERTLVILDEIHHGGDQLAWGKALRTAFDPATRRLLLSGTPFRSDGGTIPFVRYKADVCEADYTYDYGMALADGVVRQIAFAAFDGKVQWRSAGEIQSGDLSTMDEDQLAAGIRAALNPDGDWIASVLRQADLELTRHRAEIPDAGGLVIAADQFKARRYQRILEQLCGEQVTLAISDEPDASQRIADFATGRTRWIVAVQMISEGVDIPRLSVGVYASDYRTELFFRQVVGRFVRVRADTDELCSTLYVPSVEPILTYATEIERMIPKALREAEERAQREAKQSQLSLQLDLVDRFEPLSSSEAIHHATILSGESFTDAELQQGQEFGQLSGMPSNVTAAQVARLLRLAGAGRTVGTVTIDPPKIRLKDEKKPLRQLVNGKVNRLARLSEEPYARIHAQLNRMCGDSLPTATVETLNRRLEMLDRWLEKA